MIPVSGGDSLDLFRTWWYLIEGVRLIHCTPDLIGGVPSKFGYGIWTQTVYPIGNLVIRMWIEGIVLMFRIKLIVKGVHSDTILCFSYHL